MKDRTTIVLALPTRFELAALRSTGGRSDHLSYRSLCSFAALGTAARGGTKPIFPRTSPGATPTQRWHLTVPSAQWRRRDLNPRHPGYGPGVLPTELLRCGLPPRWGRGRKPRVMLLEGVGGCNCFPGQVPFWQSSLHLSSMSSSRSFSTGLKSKSMFTSGAVRSGSESHRGRSPLRGALGGLWCGLSAVSDITRSGSGRQPPIPSPG
jgi:hypothetical protein